MSFLLWGSLALLTVCLVRGFPNLHFGGPPTAYQAPLYSGNPFLPNSCWTIFLKIPKVIFAGVSLSNYNTWPNMDDRNCVTFVDSGIMFYILYWVLLEIGLFGHRCTMKVHKIILFTHWFDNRSFLSCCPTCFSAFCRCSSLKHLKAGIKLIHSFLRTCPAAAIIHYKRQAGCIISALSLFERNPQSTDPEISETKVASLTNCCNIREEAEH